MYLPRIISLTKNENMIKDSEIITKTYLKKELNCFVTKTYLKNELNRFVTKTYLKSSLKEQKQDILREVRIMMYETMENSNENMKLYYQEETNRLMTALIQNYKDELRVFNDQMTTHMEKLNDHDGRISVLELKCG